MRNKELMYLAGSTPPRPSLILCAPAQICIPVRMPNAETLSIEHLHVPLQTKWFELPEPRCYCSCLTTGSNDKLRKPLKLSSLNLRVSSGLSEVGLWSLFARNERLLLSIWQHNMRMLVCLRARAPRQTALPQSQACCALR